MASGVELTALTEFNRIKTVFLIAKLKGQFIGKEWSLTTDQSQACPIQEIFDRVIQFLQSNQINTSTVLTESDVTAFKDNVLHYSQRVLPSSKEELSHRIRQKTMGIVQLLRNHHALVVMNQMLKQNPLVPCSKIKLKNLLSLLDLESRVLLKFLSCCEDSVALECLIAQAVAQNLSHPQSLDPSDEHSIVHIQLPRVDSLKGVTSKDFKDPVKLKKIAVQLLLLQRDIPEASGICETSLMILNLLERMRINDRLFNELGDLLAALSTISKSLNVYEYYEMSPEFKAINDLIWESVDGLKDAKQEVIDAFSQAHHTRQIDIKNEPELSRILIETDLGETKKSHETGLRILTAYAEQLKRKQALYARIYKKINPSGKQVLHNSLYAHNAPLLALPGAFPKGGLARPPVEVTDLELLRQQLERQEIDLDALNEQLGPLVPVPALMMQASCSSDPVPEEILPGEPIIRWVDIVKRSSSLPEPSSSSNSLTPKQRETLKFEQYFAQRASEAPLFPRSGLEMNEEVHGLFEARLNFNPWRTFSAAWDAARAQYLTTMSLRMFCLNLEATKQAGLHGLVEMEIDREMVKQLHLALTAYHKGKELNTGHIQYTFIHVFVRLFQVHHAQERIAERFKTLRHLFKEALSPIQWAELEHLILAKVPSQDEVESIVRMDTSRSSLLMMPIVSLTCGEVKIALHCIRHLKGLSKEERKQLPPTLSERLTFLTIRNTEQKTDAMKSTHLTNAIERIEQVGRHKVAVFNVCNKCENIWPVLEALYAEALGIDKI